MSLFSKYSFFVWLSSLNVIPQRCTHASVLRPSSSMGGLPAGDSTTIGSPMVDVHLSYFQFGAIANEAAMTVRMDTCFHFKK